MTAPTVTIWSNDKRNVSDPDPFDSSKRVYRDTASYQAYMELTYGASHESWENVHILQGGFGRIDYSHRELYDYDYKCFGCGSILSSISELQDHLMEEHGVSGILTEASAHIKTEADGFILQE